jgi:hypothetical protein
MTEWFVELRANERDIHFLKNSLDSSAVSVFQEEDSVFLRAPNMLSGMSYTEARDIAVGLLEKLNGAAKVLMPSYEGVVFNAIGSKDEHGQITKHYFLHVESSHFFLHVTGKNDPTLSELINVAMTVPVAAKALLLYGSLAHNWKNLYLVMEVIEDDLGGESGVLKSYPELVERWKLCKRTANSYSAVGREARHATGFESPKAAMHIADAQQLVRQILFRWLNAMVKNA